MGKRTKWYYQYTNPQLAFARRTFKQCLSVLSASAGAFIMRLALVSGQYIPLMNNHASGLAHESLPGLSRLES